MRSSDSPEVISCRLATATRCGQLCSQQIHDLNCLELTLSDSTWSEEEFYDETCLKEHLGL